MEVTVLIERGYERVTWFELFDCKQLYQTQILGMSDKESMTASLAFALGKQGEIKTVYVTTRLTCLLTL